MNRRTHIESHTYADTIAKVVDELLVKGTRNGAPPKAIVFSTRIDFNNFHGDEDRYPVGGFLHVACFAPMNYVHVLAAFTDRPVARGQLVELEWQPIACHDSCWRDDGVKSVIVDAVRLLNQAALDAFKISVDDVSFHIALEDLLIDVEDPTTVLAKGLEGKDRHGKLSIPQYQTAGG